MGRNVQVSVLAMSVGVRGAVPMSGGCPVGLSRSWSRSTRRTCVGCGRDRGVISLGTRVTPVVGGADLHGLISARRRRAPDTRPHVAEERPQPANQSSGAPGSSVSYAGGVGAALLEEPARGDERQD